MERTTPPSPDTAPKIIARPHGYFRGAEYEDCAPAVKSSAYAANNPIVEQHVLGWSRDEHGNVIDRHPVDVANCVTSAKRDNTQNYILKTSCLDLTNGEGKRSVRSDIAPTLRSERSGVCVKEVQIGAVRTRAYCGKPMALEMGDTETSNTITSVAKDNMVVEKQSILEDFYANRAVREYEDIAPIIRSEREGLKVKQQARLDSDSDGIANQDDIQTKTKIMEEENMRVRIRKLSERELYRLMDLDEEDIDILLATDISKTGHGRLAGNSICVGVMTEIFRTLFIDTEPEFEQGKQLTLF